MNIESRRKNGGAVMFRSRFSVNNTPFRSPWFESKEEAKNWSARQRSEILDQRINTGSEMRLSVFSQLWLEKHAYANKVRSAAIKDEQHLRKHILPILGNKKLRSLTVVDFEFLFSDLKRRQRLKAKSINNILGTVKKMLNDAVRWRYITYNPSSSIAPVKIPTQEVTMLYAAEICKLLAFAEQNYPDEYELFVLALNTGCRLGECLGLDWGKIDLVNATIMISTTYDDIAKQVMPRTKGKRFRCLPLNRPCLELLRVY